MSIFCAMLGISRTAMLSEFDSFKNVARIMALVCLIILQLLVIVGTLIQAQILYIPYMIAAVRLIFKLKLPLLKEYKFIYFNYCQFLFFRALHSLQQLSHGQFCCITCCQIQSYRTSTMRNKVNL